MSAEPSETARKTTQFLYPHESYIIKGCAFDIYKQFRNTQKESVYQKSLLLALQEKNLLVEREKHIPIYFLKQKVGVYVPDLLINNQIVIELKAKPFIHPEDVRQFWYYLKNSEFRLGFLINFGEPHGVKIIRRIYDESRVRGSASGSA